MQVLTAAFTQVVNALPGILAVQNEQSRAAEETEREFFGANADLVPHKEAVERITAAYVKAHPNFNRATAMQEIALMSRVALKLPLPGTPAVAPASVPSRPAMPASAMGAHAPAPVAGQKTIWEEVIEEE